MIEMFRTVWKPIRKFLALTACTVSIFITIDTSAVNSAASFNYSDGSLKITLPIRIWGEGATPELANQWEVWVETALNNAAIDYSCIPIEFDADVQFVPPLFVPPDGSEAVAGNIGGNGYSFTKTQFRSAMLHEIRRRFQRNSTDGLEYWYVPDDANSLRRAFISRIGGSYINDGVGMIPSGATKHTVVHEAMHVIGHDDKYSDNARGYSVPDSGWSGNIMATLAGAFDRRNFHELYDAIEDEFGVDTLPSCLKLEMNLDFISYAKSPPCNNDQAIGTLEFSVMPDLSEDLDGGGIFPLTGHGQGDIGWTILQRCPGTMPQNVEITNNPFPIDVSGYLEDGGDYHIELHSGDHVCFNATLGSFCDMGLLNLVLPQSQFKTSYGSYAEGSLAEMILDTGLQSGDWFKYSIFATTPDPHWYDGHGIVIIMDKID